MEFIKKHELRTEYFDEKLWVIAGINDAEEDELKLLSPFRTSSDPSYQCSNRAHVILMAAFRKIEKVLAMKGYEHDVVSTAENPDELYARHKKTGKIFRRFLTDDKIPRGYRE